MKIITMLMVPMLLCALDLDLNNDQKSIMQISYNMGEQHDLEDIIPAMSFYETSAGINIKNYKTGCYGCLQVKLTTYMSRHGIKDTPKNQEIAFELLTEYPVIAIREGIDTLRYFLHKYNGDKFKSLAAYAGGWEWRKKKDAIEYARNVLNLAKQIHKEKGIK